MVNGYEAGTGMNIQRKHLKAIFLLLFVNLFVANLDAAQSPVSTTSSTQVQGVTYEPSSGQHLFGVFPFSIPWNPNPGVNPSLLCITGQCPAGLTPNVVCQAIYQDSSVPNNVNVSCPLSNVTVFNNQPQDNKKSWCSPSGQYPISVTAYTTYLAVKGCYIGGYTDPSKYPTKPATRISCYLYCYYHQGT